MFQWIIVYFEIFGKNIPRKQERGDETSNLAISHVLGQDMHNIYDKSGSNQQQEKFGLGFAC